MIVGTKSIGNDELGWYRETQAASRPICGREVFVCIYVIAKAVFFRLKQSPTWDCFVAKSKGTPRNDEENLEVLCWIN